MLRFRVHRDRLATQLGRRGKDMFADMAVAELRKEIALGAREADRDKFVDGASTFADIRRKSKQRKTSGR